MAKYILKRLGMAVLTILVIIIILFCLLKLMPGSPFNNERLTDRSWRQSTAWTNRCFSRW